jgi:hypothetical protein
VTTERMFALTVYQPWASLIAAGGKPVEWRGWPAPAFVIGKRIAIHASARPAKRGELAELLYDMRDGARATSLIVDIARPLVERWHTVPTSLPLATMLCTVILGQPIRAEDWARANGMTPSDSDRIDHQRWAWPLSEIELLTPMVPAIGKQGFWVWSQ